VADGPALRAAVVLAVFLGSCASLSESECRSTNWYQLGKRDGEIYASRGMIDQYTHRCAAFGVKPDEAAYMTGWDDGNMEYRQRTGYGASAM
jgi:hypothetical protein